MFTVGERDDLRAALIDRARADPSVIGLALTGSASVGREDRWSDIDLALSTPSDPQALAARWTERMYDDHGATDHLDVYRGDVLYRVFLLRSTLQVDLSFWPSAEFGATAPTFRLVFGEAVERPHTPRPVPAELVGTAWLYALHARSSLGRARMWSAQFALTGMRDAVLALACLRHGTVPVQARGIDDLPADLLHALAGTVPHGLDAGELRRAFRATADALLVEVGHADPARADRLAPLVRELAS